MVYNTSFVLVSPVLLYLKTFGMSSRYSPHPIKLETSTGGPTSDTRIFVNLRKIQHLSSADTDGNWAQADNANVNLLQ